MTSCAERSVTPKQQHLGSSEQNYNLLLIQKASPRARAFLAGEMDDESFRRAYTRHDIERANRIPVDNVLNARAVLVLASARAAANLRLLCRYLAEEAGHEQMFLEDLMRRGHDEAEVCSTPLTTSTLQLFGAFSRALDQGDVRPLMTWNLAIEQIAGSCSGRLAERAAKVWGVASVKGAVAHVKFDAAHDHEDAMKTLVDGLGGERVEDVDMILNWYAAYLDEITATGATALAVEQ